jgi:hypothetical protein
MNVSGINPMDDTYDLFPKNCKYWPKYKKNNRKGGVII